jgi:hypothetical protein
MKARISWNYYNTVTETEYCASINEMVANTWAQVRTWVENQIPDRTTGNSILDTIEIDEIGQFADSDGESCDSRPIAIYEHASGIWEWLN